jgi:hypothetical protein
LTASPGVEDSPVVSPAVITVPAMEETPVRAGDPPCPGGLTVPSMITESEAAFFTECARGPLPPGGSIVDLGCFMGSTAIALARGVMEAGCRDEVIAYDLFT